MHVDFPILTVKDAFGDAVRELRHERSESQETVAWRIGMSRPHLSNLENGRMAPSLEMIFRLGESLEVRPEELIRRTRDRLDERE